MGHILVVDDEKDMLKLLERIITSKTKYNVTIISEAKKVIPLIKEIDFDIVLLDIRMPDINGVELLKKIKEIKPNISVIMITAYGTIETAVEAMKLGAFDFITKPFKTNQIILALNRAIELQTLKKENEKLKKEIEQQLEEDFIIGNTDKIKYLYKYALEIAPTSASVLITGETGTGKELLARFIHKHSKRKGPFVAVNCSTFPEQLIESELFGHVKGAFSGAISDKKGLVEEAHEGTLFLDEIGDLPLGMQTKLLRFLQNREVRPIGAVKTKTVDIRVIAATNKDLKELIAQGKFREDLYYRLNVIEIYLPPLRQRKQDIPVLAYYFLKKYSKRFSKDISGFSPEAINILSNKDWPGNIRELENTIQRAVILCKGKEIKKEDLTPLISFSENKKYTSFLDLPFKEARKEVLKNFYREYLTNVLTRYQGNVSKAATECGLKRQYFHRLIKITGIDPNLFRTKGD